MLLSTTIINNNKPTTTTTTPIEIQKEYDDCIQLRRNLIAWTNNVVLNVEELDDSTTAAAAATTGFSIRKLYESEIQTLTNNGNRFIPARSSSKQQQEEDDDDHPSPSSSSSLHLLLPQSLSDKDQSTILKRYVSNNTFQGTVVLVINGDGEGDDDENGEIVTDLEKDFMKMSLEGGKDCDEDDDDTTNYYYDGIHSNTRIGHGCILNVHSSICNNGFISQTYIGFKSIVHNCGHITFNSSKGGDTWSTSSSTATLELEVGPESGGCRKLIVTPESNLMDLCQQLKTCNQNNNNEQTPTESQDQDDPINMNMNTICSKSQVLDTPTISNVFVYPNACIRAATCIEKCLLYPNATVSNSSICRNVLMQWNTSVTDSSNVSNVLLMEASHAGPNSTCQQTVLGPDVHVSCGEVHASILGPNTNAHHQSLVISVLWPLGRGNVAYGSNVGSNHTGRIPDQETIGGEGTFWGLSTVIKFPVNLQDSPYTVVAAGTAMPPQKLCMPFSLVVSSSTNNGGRNSILPGWVLRSSPYTLARNQVKYKNRRKAKRHLHYTGWDIIRPQTIQLCIQARKALLLSAPETTAAVAEGSSSTTEIPGIGPNELSEKARVNGIEAYTNCIQRFVLHGLLDMLINNESKSRWTPEELSSLLLAPAAAAARSDKIEDDDKKTIQQQQAVWRPFPWEVDTSKLVWDYQRTLLLEEFPHPNKDDDDDKVCWLRDLFSRLVVLEHEYARQVYESKRRDDTRGERTIPGYADSHVGANDDPVVQQVRCDAEETERKVKDLLDQLWNHKS